MNKKYVDEKTANIQPAPAGVDPAALDKVKTDLEKNQAFNTRNQKTFNARGNLNMKQKTIRNILEPTDNTDAATKGYVDEMKEFFEDKIKEVEEEAKEAKEAADRASRANPGGGVNGGNVNGAEFGDMKGKKLINVGDPENPRDGVKKYVDSKTPFTKTNGYFKTSYGLDMDLKKISNLNTPTADGDASNKKYVDDTIENMDLGLIQKNGGFLATDAIDMNTNRIYNIGKPQFETDAVPKSYIDNEINKIPVPFSKENDEYKAKEGVNMDDKKIINVGEPEDEGDAVNKKYVDTQIIIKKTLPEDMLLKILGSSITLIRGEAKGPIIGVDKTIVTGFENILGEVMFNNTFGFFSDAQGNKVDFTEVYFGSFDGGLYFKDNKNNLLNKGIEIKRYPTFTFPCDATIFNYAVSVKFKGGERIKNEVIKLRIFKLKGEGLDADTFDTRNMHGRIFTDFEQSEDITINLNGKNTTFVCGELTSHFYCKKCSYFALLFLTSHEKIERFNITLSAHIRFDFKKEDILGWNDFV